MSSLPILLSRFPLHTHPPVPLPSQVFISPTLWIHPTKDADSPLSADVECLKWQAYLALRGLSDLRVRTDVSSEGAIGRRLPNLHVSSSELLPAHHIPSWVDSQLSSPTQFEGYKNEVARDESRAWVSLLEGHVHAALELSIPRPSYLLSLLSPRPHPPAALQSIITPPPAPLSGFTSLLPPSGTHVSYQTVLTLYRDAISALSDRLATDKWFLGSESVYSLSLQ